MPVHEILHCALAKYGKLKVDIYHNFQGKMHYLSSNAQKLKAAHPVNYFSRFFDKKIKKIILIYLPGTHYLKPATSISYHQFKLICV